MSGPDIFLNVPFDAGYRPLFLALVTGVVGHGGNPRCVLELPSSVGRLERLKKLVAACSVSFHDLSRVQASRTAHGVTPRFNMPFELGLSAMGPGRFFVLEERPYRLQATLSDLNGFDPLVHDGDPLVLLRKMRDALHSPRHHPTHAALREVYGRVKRAVYADLRQTGADFFSRSTFNDILTITTAECRQSGLL